MSFSSFNTSPALHAGDLTHSHNANSSNQANDFSTTPHHLTLLGLPSEVRIQIYLRYLERTIILDKPTLLSQVRGLPASRWRESRGRWTPPITVTDSNMMLTLFLVCKLIKSEAVPILYQKATFVFVGCDIMNALYYDSVWFNDPPRFLYRFPSGAFTRLVSSVYLNMTHSSSAQGQWANQLPRLTVTSIMDSVVNRLPRLRSFELEVCSARYDVFDSQNVFAGYFLRHLCRLNRLTHLKLRQSPEEVFDMRPIFRAVNWVLNKHLLDTFEGIDTSTYDLEPDSKTDDELRQFVGREMLTHRGLRNHVLAQMVRTELDNLERRMLLAQATSRQP